MAKKKENTLEEKLQEALVPENQWPYMLPENWCWTYVEFIADKIKKRYGDKVKFLLYNKDIYEKIISSKNLSDSRISMIKNIETLELQEIKQCIKCQKKAAYQELLINDYLKLICK